MTAIPLPQQHDPVITVIVNVEIAIVHAGRYLVTERGNGESYGAGWLGFPGGKLEPGETPESALIRELQEELAIMVEPPCLAPLTFASHSYPEFHLLMPLYLCRRWDGEVSRREHSAIAWVKPVRLGDYPMPPADKPLVAYLQEFARRHG